MKLATFSLCSVCLSFPKHTKVCQFYGSFECYFILSGLWTLLFYSNSPIFGKHTHCCYITSWEGCLVHWFCLSSFQIHAVKDKNSKQRFFCKVWCVIFIIIQVKIWSSLYYGFSLWLLSYLEVFPLVAKYIEASYLTL